MTKDADEGAAHSFLVSKAGLAGDNFDWMPALLDHETRGIKPESFQGFGGGRTGLRAKRST